MTVSEQPGADLTKAAIEERYAAKVRAHEGLTSDAIVGPALGRLQTYAVVAAASADDVPALLAAVAELERQRDEARAEADLLARQRQTVLDACEAAPFPGLVSRRTIYTAFITDPADAEPTPDPAQL